MSSRNEAELLRNLSNASENYSSSALGSREELIDAATKLILSLELPSEHIQRVFWAQPATAAHYRICVDLNIFELLKNANEDGLDCESLASSSGSEASLIERILNHLAAGGLVGHKADRFFATPLSNTLTEDKYQDGIRYTYDIAGPSFRALPAYLAKTKYREPTELTNGPFQSAHQTALPFFAWLDQNPPYMSVFNNYMSAYRAGKPSWCSPGFYPVQSRLLSAFQGEVSDILLVDVGGGLGHDLRELRAQFPQLTGRLVLQDRAEVIETMKTESEFDVEAHDFFSVQKTQNARAYYLHSVLHDWGDEDCVRILKALTPALKEGYSRILINEIVVSGENVSIAATSMDQLMLVLGAMRERTEKGWRTIFKQAGLEVEGIWTYPGAAESLIELVPVK